MPAVQAVIFDLQKICEERKSDVAFQVAGRASICPGFFYAKSNAKTIHLFNIDREDFKRGYIETNEDGEIKQRKFKEDMMLLNLRLHRAIEHDDINWGMNLQSEHERFLVEKHFKSPVIIYDYPSKIKSFYMRLNDDEKTVRAMDVLFPGIGEIIGGSQSCLLYTSDAADE